MIRINLLRSRNLAGAPLVGRREAILGASLLALACIALFYLGTRPSGRGGSTPQQTPETKPAATQVSTLRPAHDPEAPPVPTPPRKPPKAQTEPAPVEKPTTPAAPAPAAGECTVSDITVEPQGEALLVVIRTGAEARYKSFELDKPDRLVVDLPGCRLAVPREQYSQRVSHPPVERVRVNLFQEAPPVVRLVLDLAQMPRHQINSTAAGVEVRVLGAAR